VPNLYALTAGPLPPNPPAILARRNVTDFLDHLRREFEWILVDSPPIASVTDALLRVTPLESWVHQRGQKSEHHPSKARTCRAVLNAVT
jgi:hypothetical protein